MNRIKALEKFGQAIWLDYIRRSLITSGDLKRLIDEDGLKGMTSNPSIFEKAIVGGADYADQLESLYAETGLDAMTIYERVAITDIRAAADVLRGVYVETKGRDGYVSMEVSGLSGARYRSWLKEARRLRCRGPPQPDD